VISKIEIESFKSFKKVSLALGHFNLFIGTNTSGKSNFFDALRVLQGIGYGFTVSEILDGKPKSSTSEVWEGLRGGSAYAAFRDRATSNAIPPSIPTFLKVSLDIEEGLSFNYEVGFTSNPPTLISESLRDGARQLYSSNETSLNRPVIMARVNKFSSKGQPPVVEFDRSRPLLHQVPQKKECPPQSREAIEGFIRALSNSQRIDPQPALLRAYSAAERVKRMGERGENFAALINSIYSDEKTRSAYVAWLKQLTPSELEDVAVLKGALNEPLFALREAGHVFPAPVLSDGTLRFAAIAAAFFQPDMPDLLTIEEIENGIHPSRLRLLVELLKTQSQDYRQVMATTHSPIVLAWLNESDYKTTFFCKRDEDTGASEIKPLSEIPRLEAIVQKQPIGDLFAEGWLEGAL